MEYVLILDSVDGVIALTLDECLQLGIPFSKQDIVNLDFDE